MTASENGHLFVLVHGLWGSPSHMLTIEKALKQLLPDVSKERIVTLKPLSNRFWKTYDGIARCAEKVIAEILYEIETLKQNDDCKVVKISIIGYSLGGLISRYVVGKLFDIGFFDDVQPVIFCTFATPHVGVHFFRDNLFDKTANAVGKFILGLTGFELFLRDHKKLLVKMSLPNSSFYKGLACFQKRLLLANIRNDRSVAFYTSYITSHSPFDEWSTLKVKYLKYLPPSKIAGVVVRPKFVDLERSYRVDPSREAPINIQEATSLLRRNKVLRYSFIFVLASIIIPFYIPLILCLSLYVSGYSILKVKLLPSPNIVRHWKEVRRAIFEGGEVNLKHAQHGEENRIHRHELSKHDTFKGDTSSFTEHGMENVLYAKSRIYNRGSSIENDYQSTEQKEDGMESPVEALGDESEGVNLIKATCTAEQRASILSSLIRRKTLIDVDIEVNASIMKNHADKLSVKDHTRFPLFTDDTKLAISEDQATIIDNLNTLSWEKIAVYHDLFNAHDGIVARRGAKWNPKGASTIYLWASILRNHLKTGES